MHQGRADEGGGVIIKMFACYCGCQDEGSGDPPKCWGCGKQMRHWNTRVARTATTTLQGEAADKRTDNGGY